MKRLILSFSLLILTAGLASAQFDEVKSLVLLGQNQKAKDMLDGLLAKPKNQGKPEASLLKATILANLSQEKQDDKEKQALLAESLGLYEKYLSENPKKELISEAAFINAPILYYSNFFNQGIKGYNEKNWDFATANFANTVKWSDFLIENKLAKMDFDTSALLLAGASFQNAKRDNEAAPYFKKIADRKIGGDDNEFLYQFLMNYYFKANDIASFNSIRDLGKSLYPKSEFFTLTDVDFIMGIEDPVEKMKRIEAKIAAEPDNTEVAESYGYILYDMLNDEPKADAKPIENKEMVESKMVQALSKSGDANPKSGKAYFYLGNHFINKAVKVNEQIEGVSKQIRTINAAAKPDKKTGKIPAPPKELTDKREVLKQAYNAEVDKALPFLIKSADGYSKAPDLKGVELQNYKRLVDQLILIYGDKKSSTKLPAEKAKFEAEEKKWTAIYSSIGK